MIAIIFWALIVTALLGSAWTLIFTEYLSGEVRAMIEILFWALIVTALLGSAWTLIAEYLSGEFRL